MTDAMKLTEQQVNHYQEHGYVLLGRILMDDDVNELLSEEARIRTADSRHGRQSAYKTLFFHQLCHSSEPVRRICTQGAHISLVKQLLGPNVCLEWNQLVTKFPDVGSGRSEFPWHQDDGYGTLEPTGITVWVALCDVDESNGCVWLVPGSHKSGLKPHNPADAENWFQEVAVEDDGVPARLKAGEAVAFSGLTLHRSKLNHTDNPRFGFFMRYCEPDTVKVNENNQPVLESAHAWMVAGQAHLA